MTHLTSSPGLPDNIFCCDCASHVDTRLNTKPYYDPNRQLHDAIYKSFIAFTERLSAAKDQQSKDQQAAQALALAELREKTLRGRADSFKTQKHACKPASDKEKDLEMTLIDLIRSYNPDRQTNTAAGQPTPSPEPSPATNLFQLPASPPTSPMNIALQPKNKSDIRAFDIDSLPFTPPPTNPSSMFAKPGQSFSDFFNNGAGVVPPSTSSSLLAKQTAPPEPVSLPRGLSTNPWSSGPAAPFSKTSLDSRTNTFQSADWRSALIPQAQMELSPPNALLGRNGRGAIQAPSWRPTQPTASPTHHPLELADDISATQPSPWRSAQSIIAQLQASTPPPFVPQRVLSPSNLINNPLLTSPPPPYAMHITSRLDFGQTESHRYFVCPADFQDDWPEVSLNQWFAAGVGFDFRAEKWDHKCLVHGRFYRMTLRPNLAMRDWGLGKGMEQVAKMAEIEAAADTKVRTEPMELVKWR